MGAYYVDKQHLGGDYSSYAWKKLIGEFSLTPQQQDQLSRYATLLIEWNKKFNLTAILDYEKILYYHFYDSVALAHYRDFSLIHTTADIGTGAGFPGIPLKILFPHLTMVLIEVNNKKRIFLEYIIKELGFENVSVYPYDWRTFIRSTDYKIDYFFARASLQPEELVRIFKPSASYNNAVLVYWASSQWTTGKQEGLYMAGEIPYEIAEGVCRKYVFFQMK